MKIGITQVSYLYNGDLDKYDFVYRDKRLTDDYTKMALLNTSKIYKDIQGDKLELNKIGLVLATDSGPLTSIHEINNAVRLNGYKGINPSKFPNVMLSTPLSRIATQYKFKGPTVSMYVNGKIVQALRYAYIQILTERCKGVMVVYVNDGRHCFNMFIESEHTADIRGLSLRFIINNEENIREGD